MLCFVLFCAGAINLCQIFVQDIWQFAGIQFVYGLFLAGAVPNVNARLVEVTDPSMRGKAFGLVTSAQQFGGVIGPLLGGFWAAICLHVIFWSLRELFYCWQAVIRILRK